MKRVVLLLLSLLCVCFPLRAQQASVDRKALSLDSVERDRGMELVRTGDYKGAIEAFRLAVKQNAADANAWFNLGFVLAHENKLSDGTKAFRTVLKLRKDFGSAHSWLAYCLVLSGKTTEGFRETDAALALNVNDKQAYFVRALAYLYDGKVKAAIKEADVVLGLDPAFADAYLVKSRALVRDYGQSLSNPDTAKVETKESRDLRFVQQNERLAQAAECLEKYVSLKPKSLEFGKIREQLDALRYYLREIREESADKTMFVAKDVAVKAVIKSKPEPETGILNKSLHETVVLKAVLSSDGTVKYILLVVTRPNGLTEAAIEAARKIKFVPAQNNGKPVSTAIQIEYHF